MSDLIDRQAAIDFIDAGHLCNPNEPRWSDNEVVNFLKSRPSAQPKSEERTAESAQNVPNDELISKKSAIEVIDAVFPVDPMKSEYAQGISCGAALAKTYVEQLPSAQPTLYGYDIKHLMLIAEVLRKENLPPERVADALTDIEYIINIVRREFEETLRESLNQFKICRGE